MLRQYYPALWQKSYFLSLSVSVFVCLCLTLFLSLSGSLYLSVFLREAHIHAPIFSPSSSLSLLTLMLRSI